VNQQRFQLIQVEPDPSQRFQLTDSLTLGRVGCDVTLDDPQASRHHAQVSIRDGRVVVEDIGSSNGTFVAGSRIDSATLLDPGVELRIGHTVWRVESVAEPVPAAAPEPAAPPPPAVRAPAAQVAASAEGFSVAPARRQVSAARRVEATFVCYAVIIATAAGVIAYLASR
jgi:predicted component of type VI protein secretion system